MSDFHSLIEGQPGPDGVTLSIPDDWMQGRSSFGGLLSAAALRAMGRAVGDVAGAGREPRAITTHFLGPVGPEPATLTTEVLRSGRAMTFVEARVHQGGELKVSVQGSFGAPRESEVRVTPPTRPEAPPPDSLADMPFVEGLMPSFVQHFSFRWADGFPPYSGGDAARLKGWCRHRTAAPVGPEAVVGLLDAWPSPVLGMLTRPAPASTVSWTAHLVDVPATTPEGWWWFESAAQVARDGYATFQGRLYRPDGVLAAHLDQLVAVFG